MSYGELKVGAVIPMNSFTANWDGLNLSYKRPGKRGEGKQYAFLLLGIGSPEEPLNGEKVLRSLGWIPEDDPELKELREKAAQYEALCK